MGKGIWKSVYLVPSLSGIAIAHAAAQLLARPSPRAARDGVVRPLCQRRAALSMPGAGAAGAGAVGVIVQGSWAPGAASAARSEWSPPPGGAAPSNESLLELSLSAPRRHSCGGPTASARSRCTT
jgi:hypothetical protein